jgi:GNAT superfamily N-acetyltransferase
MKERNVPVVMLRDHLDKIPEFDLPGGYFIQEYRPGDEETWVSIQSAADLYNTITLDLFRQEFGHDPNPLSERQLYLCSGENQYIGTATAWFGDYEGKNYGRVHWVAMAPVFQGRGLAKPLMTAVCNQLKVLGHNRAYLTTSSARVAAINLYLKFGFRLVHDDGYLANG